jgi:hypothetical protein
MCQKVKAAAIHSVVTAVILAATASVVYFVWYPNEFAKMLGGTNLLLIIGGVELCLGPLMSLVIYNSNKSLKELTIDYLVVGTLQVLALLYGLYSIALSRPVFLVFVKDRIEVVAAAELETADLLAAKEKSFQSLPWLGPELICTESPVNLQEKSDLLISGLKGKDIQLLPKYYRKCFEGEVMANAKTQDDLYVMTKISMNDLPSDMNDYRSFKWLPVVTRFNYWIVVYEGNSTENPRYLDLNPFETH